MSEGYVDMRVEEEHFYMDNKCYHQFKYSYKFMYSD